MTGDGTGHVGHPTGVSGVEQTGGGWHVGQEKGGGQVGQVTTGHSVGTAVVGQVGGGGHVAHLMGGRQEGQVVMGHTVGAAVVGQAGGGGHVVAGGHVAHVGDSVPVQER